MSIDPVESPTMSDSTFAEFGELVSQLLNAELRSNNSRNDSAVVETSMAVDSVNGWANESSWSLFTDMLDTGSSVYAAYACNTGPSAWTFDADFIPNWGTTESGHRPSSATSSSSLNREQSFSPYQFFTSETNSDVDDSPLQLFSDRFESNSINHPNCNPAPPPSSFIPSAFPSPAIHKTSAHPSPAISQALTFTCTVCGKTYKTKNNLQRHRRDALHGPSSLFAHASPAFTANSSHSTPIISLFPDKKLYECPHPDCARKGENGFPRKDNMIQHQRLVHNANLPKRERRKGAQRSGISKR